MTLMPKILGRVVQIHLVFLITILMVTLSFHLILLIRFLMILPLPILVTLWILRSFPAGPKGPLQANHPNVIGRLTFLKFFMLMP